MSPLAATTLGIIGVLLVIALAVLVFLMIEEARRG